MNGNVGWGQDCLRQEVHGQPLLVLILALALLLCMPGDVYEGRCYLGPPAGQTLIQVLAGGECLRGWAYSTHIVHCS